MKIACVGGGPGGLYFAISMKLKNPEIDITVIERNKAVIHLVGVSYYQMKHLII